MTATEEVQAVQKRFDERGIRAVGFTWSPTMREDVASGKTTLDDVKRDVAQVLNSYLDGNTAEFPHTFDSDGNKVYTFDEELSK